MIGTRIHITGIVQGVGFRPFVYNQAVQQALTGWVCNTSAGVDIEVNGDPDEISAFINRLKSDAPPLARIDTVEHHKIPYTSCNEFIIVESKAVADAFQPISPDISICPDCLNELFDPSNRRYRYPFINCTNCGPRLTIIEEIPYDRPNTTMKDFPMCPSCNAEYTNPADRRFHAQPIACPDCGPKVWLEIPSNNKTNQNKTVATDEEAILATQKLLRKGGIVAIKGLGGFHLACDATNKNAVAELRRRKLRVDKPFAIMMPDIQTIETHCQLGATDRELLVSKERPIVIMARKSDSTISKDVSPRQNTLGVMLPYTPLHYLLFDPFEKKKVSRNRRKSWKVPPLVMTSGNLSEEPIAVDNQDARNRLRGIADAYLMHNRDIHTRCDDSVVRSFRGVTQPLRRSRGYTPFPVYLQFESPQVLAVGGELKNTFCITRDRYAFLSHHIGDMENAETFSSFTNSISHYETLFRIKPEAIAYDLHPNYLATRYAVDRANRDGILSFGVQHHFAHIAACMLENSLPKDKPVIGVAFDGTGYGDDGAIWGGEFLIANYQGYRRVCHLKYIPLPGGDAAIRKPARIGLAYLWAIGIDWDLDYHPVSALCAEERSILKSQLEKKINTPLTSSMGRFFDAAASLAGVRQSVNYEAQAAIELEAMADPDEKSAYQLDLEVMNDQGFPAYQIDPAPLVLNLIGDVQRRISTSIISARFHNSITNIVTGTCCKIRKDYGVNDVTLSGGVWQNMTLFQRTYDQLIDENFNVFYHNRVPTNDGGLALGQAIVAIHKMIAEK